MDTGIASAVKTTMVMLSNVPISVMVVGRTNWARGSQMAIPTMESTTQSITARRRWRGSVRAGEAPPAVSWLVASDILPPLIIRDGHRSSHVPNRPHRAAEPLLVVIQAVAARVIALEDV